MVSAHKCALIPLSPHIQCQKVFFREGGVLIFRGNYILEEC